MTPDVEGNGAALRVARLRMENRRTVNTDALTDALSAEQARWFRAYCGLSEASDDESSSMSLEVVDVVDVRTGAVVHEFLLWHWMQGVVVQAGSTTRVAVVVQHSASRCSGTSKAWLVDFARAWWEGAPRLGMDVAAFGFDDDELGNHDVADDV